jgi:hypothetical protein
MNRKKDTQIHPDFGIVNVADHSVLSRVLVPDMDSSVTWGIGGCFGGSLEMIKIRIWGTLGEIRLVCVTISTPQTGTCTQHSGHQKDGLY